MSLYRTLNEQEGQNIWRGSISTANLWTRLRIYKDVCMGVHCENVNTKKAVCNRDNFELHLSVDPLRLSLIFSLSRSLSLSLYIYIYIYMYICIYIYIYICLFLCICLCLSRSLSSMSYSVFFFCEMGKRGGDPSPDCATAK